MPCQLEQAGGKSWLHWVEDDLAAGAERIYLVQDGAGAVPGRSAVEVKDSKGQSLEFLIGRQLFTRYHYSHDASKPFFYPVIGPYGGVKMTRGFPIEKNISGETQDHKHHRSLYVAFGSVNGINIWDEEEGHGSQRHRAFASIEAGSAYGGFVADIDWVDKNEKCVMKERRNVRIYNTPACARVMDIGIVFKATEGKVCFGDTKEGGIVSVRVASSMDGDKAGRIENAYGGAREKETWGKKAPWCDYSGPVASQWGNVWVGVSIFDNPANLRYPTEWHVRDYGLFTANCFGHSSFYGPGHDGSYEVPAGAELKFNYRLYFHSGDAKEGGVEARFHDYVNPPIVEIV